MIRGIRNNNPANIRHDSVMWRGETKGGDKSFKTFGSMAWGVRAVFHLINNYNRLYGLNTIEKIISRWAPPSENDTAAYIKFVSEASVIAPTQVISTKSSAVMIPIVNAMIRMECGMSVSEVDLNEGWRLFVSASGSKGGVMAVMVAVLLLSACTKTVYVPQVSYRSIIDTVTEQVEDSAVMRALFECDSLGQVRMRELDETKGRLAHQEVAFADGRLKVETRWKTKYIDRMVEIRDTITVIEIREVVREVRHVPRFYQWCFAVALFAVGGWLWRFIGGLRRL